MDSKVDSIVGKRLAGAWLGGWTFAWSSLAAVMREVARDVVGVWQALIVRPARVLRT
jgi:hypothetical protein